MAIDSVLLNVADLEKSIDFYTRFLDAELVEQNSKSALLDAVTAKIKLVRLDDPERSTWIPDDLQRGFRHIGFKVSDLHNRVAKLKAADVPFHLEPIHAEGDVLITFFFDPDGTLVEMVEGPLRYHEVYDSEAVDADWGIGSPDRPRFDHVAETVADAHITHEYYASRGYTLMGGIHQPSDSRGFEITYLRGGDSSIEVFEFGVPTIARSPQQEEAGFLAMELGGLSETSQDDESTGMALVTDPDGLAHTTGGSRNE